MIYIAGNERGKINSFKNGGNEGGGLQYSAICLHILNKLMPNETFSSRSTDCASGLLQLDVEHGFPHLVSVCRRLCCLSILIIEVSQLV